MELWMAVDAHNKGVDAQNRVLKGLYRYTSSGRGHFDEEQESDPDPYPH